MMGRHCDCQELGQVVDWHYMLNHTSNHLHFDNLFVWYSQIDYLINIGIVVVHGIGYHTNNHQHHYMKIENYKDSSEKENKSHLRC